MKRARHIPGRSSKSCSRFSGWGSRASAGQSPIWAISGHEFVERRKWLDEAGYVDIVALCQFLPGPASSQVAVTLGTLRAGLLGSLAAWFGFTMPSAVALVAFGYGVGALGNIAHVPWLHGLKIVAVAVVAQAVWGMARGLCPDRERATVAVGAALLALFVPSAAGQIGAIAVGALIGWWFFPAAAARQSAPLAVRIPRLLAVLSLGFFFVLLFGLPLLAAASAGHVIALVSSFYRSGALVFGGGHVVLPLLQQAVVPPGWVGNEAFLAGYGAAQAVPGPLFTFAAYLGTIMGPSPQWLAGRADLPGGHLPALVSSAHGDTSVLGCAEGAHWRAHRTRRGQCSGGGPTLGSAVYAGLDERD